MKATVWKWIKGIALFVVTLGALSSLIKGLIKETGVDVSWLTPYAESFFKIAVTIAAVLLSFVGYAIFKLRREERRRQLIRERQIARVGPLIAMIEDDQNVSLVDVLPYATDSRTRQFTYHLLLERDLSGLFPEEFLTTKDAAESYLVNWLEYGTELGEAPDDIDFVSTVSRDDEQYHVFKFRTDPPHLAADRGWMVGVVGPYGPESATYRKPGAVFTSLNKFDQAFIDEEVSTAELIAEDWSHDTKY